MSERVCARVDSLRFGNGILREAAEMAQPTCSPAGLPGTPEDNAAQPAEMSRLRSVPSTLRVRRVPLAATMHAMTRVREDRRR